MEGAVAAVRSGLLDLEDGRSLPFAECIWCTQGGAQRWLRDTGLALDSAGFISVEDTLRSTNDPAVFAAGDVHSSVKHPRPKAGVYAVRQVSVRPEALDCHWACYLRWEAGALHGNPQDGQVSCCPRAVVVFEFNARTITKEIEIHTI